MAEIFRVLRKGGRFVFVEAGEGHSQNVASQREMEEIGVLEQDIVIADILTWAEKTGFSEVFLAPAFEPTSTIAASQWRRLGTKWGMLGAEPRLLARQVVDYARKHPAMVLLKPGGSLRQNALPSGRIVSVDAPRSVSAGQLFRV